MAVAKITDNFDRALNPHPHPNPTDFEDEIHIRWMQILAGSITSLAFIARSTKQSFSYNHHDIHSHYHQSTNPNLPLWLNITRLSFRTKQRKPYYLNFGIKFTTSITKSFLNDEMTRRYGICRAGWLHACITSIAIHWTVSSRQKLHYLNSITGITAQQNTTVYRQSKTETYTCTWF